MDRTWLITGSARGLGRMIVEAALVAGDTVVATARNPGRLDDLVGRFGSKIRAYALDVTNEAEANRAVEFALHEFGAIDVLVNNAGYGHIVPFEQTDAQAFRDQVETNFFGVVNLVRAVLPHMRKRRDGHIINVSSVGGRGSVPGLSAYQSAKWAVSGFSEVLAKETSAFGIKVIALEPGGMRTDWGTIASEQRVELLKEYEPSVGALLKYLESYFGSEIGDPRKVADVVVDLVGRDDLPAHLLLGSDALAVYASAEGERQRALEEWAEVSRSVDIEETDLGFLNKI